MTTEDLLWNAAFENDANTNNSGYNYREELSIERYYEEKELFDRLAEYLKPAV